MRFYYSQHMHLTLNLVGWRYRFLQNQKPNLNKITPHYINKKIHKVNGQTYFTHWQLFYHWLYGSFCIDKLSSACGFITPTQLTVLLFSAKFENWTKMEIIWILMYNLITQIIMKLYTSCWTKLENKHLIPSFNSLFLFYRTVIYKYPFWHSVYVYNFPIIFRGNLNDSTSKTIIFTQNINLYTRSDACYQLSFVSKYSKNNTYKFQQKVKVAAPLRKWMFGFLMIVL